MPKKGKKRTGSRPKLEKDLRFGKYLAIPPEKFSGNIFSMGDRFYQVQNNTAWKKIPGIPTENNEDFLQFA